MHKKPYTRKITYSDDSSILDDDIDDFVVESLLEEEVREFHRLVRLQKIIEIQARSPKYIV